MTRCNRLFVWGKPPIRHMNEEEEGELNRECNLAKRKALDMRVVLQ